ncbi:MAG: hypothetical protein ACYTG5_02785 [Planctomycetota bacterium]|jgi:hypothetical protein
MRNSILSISLALLATAPLSAQITGSINSKYPKMSQTVETTDGNTVAVKFAAINWGQGAFLESTENERFRNYVNGQADENPIGSLETSKGMTLGGKSLAAGKYSLAFKINDDAKWTMVLKSGDNEHSYVLSLGDSAEKRSRLNIALVPSADGGACSLNINFGTKACSFEGAATKDSDG